MSNFLWSDNALCVKNQMLILFVATLGIFVSRKSYSGASLIQFHLKGNNESKSVSKRVVQCRFPPIIPRNM